MALRRIRTQGCVTMPQCYQVSLQYTFRAALLRQSAIGGPMARRNPTPVALHGIGTAIAGFGGSCRPLDLAPLDRLSLYILSRDENLSWTQVTVRPHHKEYACLLMVGAWLSCSHGTGQDKDGRHFGNRALLDAASDASRRRTPWERLVSTCASAPLKSAPRRDPFPVRG